jgi:hypothetical protein
MFLHKEYNVADVDEFDAHNYPEVINELVAMKTALVGLSAYYRDDIIISFFKDHSIKRTWKNENPQVFTKVSQGMLKAPCLELLFDACRTNKDFLRAYERYIKQALI